jgi:hypothetical protein
MGLLTGGVTLMVPEKLEILRRPEIVDAKVRLLLPGALDRLSMIWRNRRTIYKCLWHQVRV